MTKGTIPCPSSGTNMEAAIEVCLGERAEKEAAALSSVLAWRLPGTGGLVGRRLWGLRSRARLSDLAAAGGETDSRRHWGSAHRGTRGPEGERMLSARACGDERGSARAHPQTPALRAFPSLPRCRGSLAASKPLALQPQGQAEAACVGATSPGADGPPRPGMSVLIFPTFLARFPGVSVIETPPAGAGDAGGAWRTWARKIPGEEMAAFSNIPALQSPADRGARRAAVRGVAESQD